MTDTYHVFNCCSWHEYNTLAEAKAAAHDSINDARGQCDPHWPAWVDEIAVVYAPAGSEDPEEAGEVLYVTRERRIPAPEGYEEYDDVDYWCDYDLMPAGGDHLDGIVDDSETSETAIKGG